MTVSLRMVFAACRSIRAWPQLKVMMPPAVIAASRAASVHGLTTVVGFEVSTGATGAVHTSGTGGGGTPPVPPRPLGPPRPPVPAPLVPPRPAPAAPPAAPLPALPPRPAVWLPPERGDPPESSSPVQATSKTVTSKPNAERMTQHHI